MKRVIILLLILLIPCASALNIDEFTFLSHGRPITTVSLGRIPNIDLKIVISGVDFTKLTADVSSLNSNEGIVAAYEYDEKDTTSCESGEVNNETIHTCYIRGLELNLVDSGAVTIPVTIYNGSRSETFDQSFTFTIDDTKPEITFIGTENCIGDICYFASDKYNTIVMTFQDSQATFEKKLVRFSLAGDKHFIYECDGMTCYGRAKETCTSGQNLALMILPSQTMDDAYNRLSNSLRNDVLCDSEVPEVQSTKIESTTAEYVKVGDTMIVMVNVSDDMGPVLGTGNFSEFGGDSEEAICEKKGDNWECVFSTSVIGDNPYIATAEITIKDFAGNEVTYETDPVDVLGLLEDEEPNYWTLSYEFSPEIINKQMVPYVQKKIYMHTTLSPRANNVDVLSSEISNCQAMGGGSTHLAQGSPSIFNYNIGNKNPIILFTLSKSELPEDMEKLKLNCTLTIRTRKDTSVGNFFVTRPETEIIILEVDLVNLDSPDKQIREEVERIRNASLKWEEKYGDLRDWSIKGRQICDGVSLITPASVALSGAALVIQPISPVAGSEISTTATSMNSAKESILESSAVGGVCDFLTCKAEYQTKMTDIIGNLPGVDAMASGIGMNNYSTFVNPDDSLVMSALTLCLPSFLYNMQKSKAIDCEYLNCLTRDFALGNYPVSACADMRNTYKCEYVVGEVFEIIPWTAIADEATEFVKETISNPVSLIGLLLSKACLASGGGTGGPLATVCNIAAGSNQIITYLQTIQQFQGFKAKYDQYSGVADSCDRILGGVDDFDSYMQELKDSRPPAVSLAYDSDTGCDPNGCKLNVPATTRGGIDYPTRTIKMVTFGDDAFYYDEKGNSVHPLTFPPGTIDKFGENYLKWKNDYTEGAMTQATRDAYNDFTSKHQEALKLEDDYVKANKDYTGYKTAERNAKNAQKVIERYDGKSDDDLTPRQKTKLEAALATKLASEKTINEIKVRNDGADLDGLKDHKNELKGDAAEARKEADKAKNEALRDDQAEQNWGGIDSWSTFLNVIRGYNYVSSILVNEDIIPSWRDRTDELFYNVIREGNALIDKEYSKSLFCEHKLPDQPSAVFIDSGKIGYSVAAHVQGERTELLEDENGDEFYTYTISGLVAPNKKGLDFEIILNPGREVLYSNKTTEDLPSFAFVEDEVLILESDKLYTTVCLKLDDWEDFFDLTNADNPDQLCNRISEVGS